MKVHHLNLQRSAYIEHNSINENVEKKNKVPVVLLLFFV